MVRIVTHGDFDGVCCAVLFCAVREIDSIYFADPGTIQAGQLKIFSTDILCDLPYSPKCGEWVDHHSSNQLPPGTKFKGLFRVEKSAARVSYDYLSDSYLEQYLPMIVAADKIDSASVSIEEVLHPDSWGWISETLDSDRSHESDLEYKRWMVDQLLFKSPSDIVNTPRVKERIEAKKKDLAVWDKEVEKLGKVENEIFFMDAQGHRVPKVGGLRLYAKYPKARICISIYDDRDDPTLSKISVGKNVFNPDKLNINVGQLMKSIGGGGHEGVGGATVKKDKLKDNLKIVFDSIQSVQS